MGVWLYTVNSCDNLLHETQAYFEHQRLIYVCVCVEAKLRLLRLARYVNIMPDVHAVMIC